MTKQINVKHDTPGGVVWQGRFHDHIIHDEKNLNYIRNYLLNNPALWKEDGLYMSGGDND